MTSRISKIVILSGYILSWLLISPASSKALEPEEVVVIANAGAKDSVALAEYYMRQRHIPLDHIIRIGTTSKEHCSRATYDKEIRGPIRKALLKINKTSRIRCLAVMYGMPLAIEPSSPDNTVPPAQNMDTRAAVDSELALVLTDDYPLEGWLPNPYFLGFRQQKTLLKRDTVLMVSRLDGPNPATVRRLVDDALFAENKGLEGRAYFDARWPKPTEQKLSGYALYDAALHASAEGVRKSGRMKEVKLDANEALFQPGDCPNAALYCGWYSLGQYVNAFTWVRGAIGYHIASAECTTLKEPGSQVWCKRMLEEGVAATIGPVYEPYVQAFPLPDLFFQTLTEGYLTLAEAYLISLPYLSWQMVLIGDPLYKPFTPK